MPRLRRLSGPQVIAILARFGFSVSGQKGSHVKMARVTGGRKEILTIPNHKDLDTGTLRAIIRQASADIQEMELRPHFYTE